MDGFQASGERIRRLASDRVAARSSFRTLRVLQAAIAPYREACRKAGIPCEFKAGRANNVSDRVTFLVAKVAKGLQVTIKDRPDTEEVIPLAKLRVSIGKSAYDYTDKHLGPREAVGNKGGSLSNRLRAALKGGAK